MTVNLIENKFSSINNIVINFCYSYCCSVQATAIGQAMLEAEFIECMLTENVFMDGPAIYKPLKPARAQINPEFLEETRTTCDAQEPAWVKTIPQHDSTTGRAENP